MSESKNNELTYGASGKFSDLLMFRRRGKKTFMTKPPVASEKEPSEKQLAHREKFQRASIYTQVVKADPALKKAYSDAVEDGQTYRNVAVADFFSAPDIREIDVAQYSGQTGEQIRVQAEDDFKVKAVEVIIQNADETLVERGFATQVDGSIEWIYTTTASNESLSGDKITVLATDNPDNLTEAYRML